MDKEAQEKIEQVLINRCEECVKARFGDARDASEFVAKDRDKITQALEGYRKLPDRPELREKIANKIRQSREGVKVTSNGVVNFIEYPISEELLTNQILALIPELPKDKPPLDIPDYELVGDADDYGY